MHEELPHELDAVQVTVVVPSANVLPEAGAHDTVGVGVPVAVGVEKVTTGLQVVMFAGHALITGASLIVTLKEQLEDPQELVAVQVTLVVPVANVEPEACEHETEAAGVPEAVGVVQVATWLSH